MKENKKKISSKLYLSSLACIGAFMLVVYLGTNLTMRGTYSASTHTITFKEASGGEIGSQYNPPAGGACQTDQYGFLDASCAYQVGCICREWSKTKAGSNIEGCPYPCQGTALHSAAIYTTKFDSDTTYYCVAGTSYASTCELSAPVSSCYKCTVNGTDKFVTTINTTRAAAMTGASSASDCTKDGVAASACETPTYACYLVNHKYVWSATQPSGGIIVSTIDASKCTDCEPEYIKNSDGECVKPEVKSCYACDTKDGKLYATTTSASLAEKATGGTNCTVTADTYCNVPNNPTTGTTAIIIAWIAAAIALGCAGWYFKKTYSVKSK